MSKVPVKVMMTVYRKDLLLPAKEQRRRPRGDSARRQLLLLGIKQKAAKPLPGHCRRER